MERANNPIYQSIKQAAQTTGLSQYYLRSGVKAGRIPHLKSGTKVLINVPRLLQQLEAADGGGVAGGR